MSESQERQHTWAEIRELAETRPAMFIGSQETGHKSAISDVLRLVWQAKVFRRPQAVTIDLSPTQYVARAECGPLIRPVQQIFTFGGGETLSGLWREQSKAYFSRIEQEDEQRGLAFSRRRDRRGWRYCFSGPLGPRLNVPQMPSIFAHLLVWGLRTDAGMWCEGWTDAIPTGKPFLFEQASAIGLLAAAHLDARWFTGVPFTEADAQWFGDLSHHHYWSHPKHEPRRFWTPGDITVHWHPQDDLVSDRTLTAEGVRELLQDAPRVETRGEEVPTVQGT